MWDAIQQMPDLLSKGTRLADGTLAGPAKSRTKRTGLILARLVQKDGVTAALPTKSMGSADIVAAGGADGVVIVPADAAGLPAGAVVEFRPWRALW